MQKEINVIDEVDIKPIGTRLRNRSNEFCDDENESSEDIEPVIRVSTRSSGPAINMERTLECHFGRKRSPMIEDTEIEMPSMYCPLHGIIIEQSEAVIRDMNGEATLAPCFCKIEKIGILSWDEAVKIVASQIDVYSSTLKYWVRKRY